LTTLLSHPVHMGLYNQPMPHNGLRFVPCIFNWIQVNRIRDPAQTWGWLTSQSALIIDHATLRASDWKVTIKVHVQMIKYNYTVSSGSIRFYRQVKLKCAKKTTIPR
jgi:hypothetical protein